MVRPKSLEISNIKNKIFKHIHDILGIQYYARDIYYSDAINYIVHNDKNISSFTFTVNKQITSVSSSNDILHYIFKLIHDTQVKLKFILSINDSILFNKNMNWFYKYDADDCRFIVYHICNNEYVVHLIPYGSSLDVSEEYLTLYKMFQHIVNSADMRINYNADNCFSNLNYAVCLNDSDFISLAWELEDYGVSHSDFVKMLNNFITLVLDDYFKHEDIDFLLELISRHKSFISLINILKLIRRTVDSIYSVDALEDDVELTKAKKATIIEFLTEHLKQSV